MKKKRSARLSIVADLEERKRKQADKFLADHVARVENDKVQLVQLENYLAEYQQQYKTTCAQGISVQNLMSYQAFMVKIGNVIEQHKVSMKHNQEQLAGVRVYWSKVCARQNAVDSLIVKVKNKEQQAADKALQQLIDEASQLRFTKLPGF
jgi:flagellar FliJ protein